MTICKDIPSEKFVFAFAAHLKEEGCIKVPEIAKFIKTGISRQYSPMDPDWYYIRAAALLRRLYSRSNIGVKSFANIYGKGEKNTVLPQHFKAGARGIPRDILQQLEAAGYVAKGNGRALTSKGRKMMDQFSKNL